jgi:hypothetical protein
MSHAGACPFVPVALEVFRQDAEALFPVGTVWQLVSETGQPCNSALPSDWQVQFVHVNRVSLQSWQAT